MLETTWFRFDQGGIDPCLILRRGAYLGWLSAPYGEDGVGVHAMPHYYNPNGPWGFIKGAFGSMDKEV
jgi:hypothetical protein